MRNKIKKIDRLSRIFRLDRRAIDIIAMKLTRNRLSQTRSYVSIAERAQSKR